MSSSRGPATSDVWMAAVAACLVLGLGVARLTLKLNPHLSEDFSDTFLLHFWLLLAYGAAGAVLGALGAFLVAVPGRRLEGRPRWFLTVAVVAGLGLGPLLYLLLLPDLGSGSGVLTNLLAAEGAERLGLSGGLVAFLLVAGWSLVGGLGALARRFRVRVRILWSALCGLAVLGLVLGIGPDPASPAEDVPAEDLPVQDLPPAREPPPPRVVLLCIDGADLDDVILPMVGDGDLPHFSRLMREGTWGPLATFTPTLSAVVWTSLITGKPPEAHGVHHFLHFRLPGIRQAIYKFPLHTGLNFRLFPLLEKVPGMPVLRTPYTSNMRRAEALWNIVGRRYRVGAFRWLMSWPAEELNGFSVAGGLGWVQFSEESQERVRKKLRGQATFPPGLQRLLSGAPGRKATAGNIAAYVGGGHAIDRADPRLRAITASFEDNASRELPVLIQQFDARFTASSFYPVDHFHHLYNAYRDKGGIFSDAIAERYRFTDARLGELMKALGDDVQLIVVSDHGYDFERNHHTYAPAGVLFARGPAFEAGRRVEGLSVYDVAPLVLHLLDMPLPDDMPGARTGDYLGALNRRFLDSHPPSRIATYETLKKVSHESIESPRDDEIRDVLKSLGYIQ